jgi:hypothetical protein
MESKPDKYIVLDLDSTLIHASVLCTKTQHPNLLAKKVAINQKIYCVHFRPYLHTFLDWCDERGLRFIIYSSAYEEYVHKITKCIFDERKNKPFKILCSDHLDTANYAKTFDKILEHAQIPATQILIAIDDWHMNFSNDNPDQVYLIKEWENQENDNCLLHVMGLIDS